MCMHISWGVICPSLLWQSAVDVCCRPVPGPPGPPSTAPHTGKASVPERVEWVLLLDSQVSAQQSHELLLQMLCPVHEARLDRISKLGMVAVTSFVPCMNDVQKRHQFESILGGLIRTMCTRKGIHIQMVTAPNFALLIDISC